MKDIVRHKALIGYSKEQQDDFFGDALLHLCEKASDGYFKDVQTMQELSARSYAILKHKAGDKRDKFETFCKHVDIDQRDISDMYNGGFDLLEDDDDHMNETKSVMRSFIKTLPGKEGDSFRMYIDGYSDDEIMETLDMTRNSVQKARCKAKAKVVEYMQSLGYGCSRRNSETRSSAEADASADFFCLYGKNMMIIPYINVNKTNKTMTYENTSERKRKKSSVRRSISEVRLDFMDGAQLGELPIAIESGSTKRKVRRILEKRVNQEYWSHVKNRQIRDNRHRASSKKYVTRVTETIFGGPVVGFKYCA